MNKKAAAILGLVTVGGVLLVMSSTSSAKTKQTLPAPPPVDDDDDDDDDEPIGKTPDDFFNPPPGPAPQPDDDDDDDDDDDELTVDDLPVRSPGLPQAPSVPKPPKTQPAIPLPPIKTPVVIDVPNPPTFDNIPVIVPRPAPNPAPTPPPIVIRPPAAPNDPPKLELPALDPVTNAMVESLLAAEKSAGWKRPESSVTAWQKKRGLTQDGKFGPTSAKTLALEASTIPIVRFWPLSAGPRPDLALADYRAALNAIADKADPARAALLRASARRETGQSFGPPQGTNGKFPV